MGFEDGMIKQVRALDVGTTCGAPGRDRCGVLLHVGGSRGGGADAAGDAMGRPWLLDLPRPPSPRSPSQGEAAQLTAARSPLLLWSNSGQSLRAERRRQGYCQSAMGINKLSKCSSKNSKRRAEAGH